MTSTIVAGGATAGIGQECAVVGVVVIVVVVVAAVAIVVATAVVVVAWEELVGWLAYWRMGPLVLSYAGLAPGPFPS